MDLYLFTPYVSFGKMHVIDFFYFETSILRVLLKQRALLAPAISKEQHYGRKLKWSVNSHNMVKYQKSGGYLSSLQNKVSINLQRKLIDWRKTQTWSLTFSIFDFILKIFTYLGGGGWWYGKLKHDRQTDRHRECL